MSACTPTCKSIVSILITVYEPRMNWLWEQLQSLEAQTYANLRCMSGTNAPLWCPMKGLLQKHHFATAPAFPHMICHNEENLGANKAFELLTGEAEETYFTYCNEDTIWLPKKVETLVGALESH